MGDQYHFKRKNYPVGLIDNDLVADLALRSPGFLAPENQSYVPDGDYYRCYLPTVGYLGDQLPLHLGDYLFHGGRWEIASVHDQVHESSSISGFHRITAKLCTPSGRGPFVSWSMWSNGRSWEEWGERIERKLVGRVLPNGLPGPVSMNLRRISMEYPFFQCETDNIEVDWEHYQDQKSEDHSHAAPEKDSCGGEEDVACATPDSENPPRGRFLSFYSYPPATFRVKVEGAMRRLPDLRYTAMLESSPDKYAGTPARLPNHEDGTVFASISIESDKPEDISVFELGTEWEVTLHRLPKEKAALKAAS